jgi:peptidoglycan/LPS O-acetylase OafA/YrhL
VTAVSQAPSSGPGPEPVVAPPPGNPRFPLVDGLRAIAAISVLVFHAAFHSGAMRDAWWGEIAGRFEIGVAVFFVISGFLLYRPFCAARFEGREAPAVGAFYRRRVLRIVPAYWLALTVLAVYPGLSGVFSGDWWVYYGFGQIYSQQTFAQGIPQAWTLCVEATFYLALPLYALAIGRLGARSDRGRRLRLELGVLAALTSVCLAVRIAVLGPDAGLLSYSLIGLFDWFAAGMALAVASVWLASRDEQPGWARRVAARPGACWAGALGVFLVLALTVPVPSTTVPYSQIEYHLVNVLSPVVGVLAMLPAVVGLEGGGAVRRFLSLRVVGWLGLVSYGIYLWHTEVIVWLVEHGLLDSLPWLTTPLLALIALAVTCAIAATSYYAVERPLARLKDSRRARRAG